MPEDYPLITTIVSSIVFAFLLGFLANRLKLPAILGYLLAGIALGPYTPGFVANVEIAKQLAEIGVILLMFGVGLHFSIKDLIAVRKIALQGAIIQASLTSIIGFYTAIYFQFNFLEALVFGVSVSVASTIVLIRAYQSHRIDKSNIAKIAIGWLIVEDILMIIILVLLPIIAFFYLNQEQNLTATIVFESIFLIFIKISIFVIAMTVIGRKILPRLLVAIAKTKSQELMSLGILAIACGFAYIAYSLFQASFALGAFIAGLILNESEIGKKSAEKSIPLRDVFAILFFISVGMLFDFKVIFKEPLLIFITFILIVFIKPIIVYVIMRISKKPVYDSLLVSVGLAQIGEFSFILTALALKLKIFPAILYDIVIAGAFLSIVINPLLFKLVKKLKAKQKFKNNLV